MNAKYSIKLFEKFLQYLVKVKIWSEDAKKRRDDDLPVDPPPEFYGKDLPKWIAKHLEAFRTSPDSGYIMLSDGNPLPIFSNAELVILRKDIALFHRSQMRIDEMKDQERVFSEMAAIFRRQLEVLGDIKRALTGPFYPHGHKAWDIQTLAEPPVRKLVRKVSDLAKSQEVTRLAAANELQASHSAYLRELEKHLSEIRSKQLAHQKKVTDAKESNKSLNARASEILREQRGAATEIEANGGKLEVAKRKLEKSYRDLHESENHLRVTENALAEHRKLESNFDCGGSDHHKKPFSKTNRKDYDCNEPKTVTFRADRKKLLRTLTKHRTARSRHANIVETIKKKISSLDRKSQDLSQQLRKLDDEARLVLEEISRNLKFLLNSTDEAHLDLLERQLLDAFSELEGILQ